MLQLELPIEGMTCDGCVQRVRDALSAVSGVAAVDVSLPQARAVVTLTDESAAAGDRPLASQLIEAVRAVGYGVPHGDIRPIATSVGAASQKASSNSPLPGAAFVSLESLTLAPWRVTPASNTPAASQPFAAPTSPRANQSLTLEVAGMHCASCTARVEQALRGVPGVAQAGVNLATSEASVTFDPATASVGDLLAAVDKAGYAAHVAMRQADGEPGRHAGQREATVWGRRLIVGAVLLAPLMVADAVLGHASWRGWLDGLLATPVQVFLGWPFLMGAWRRLKHGGASMDTLVALGTGAAYLAGVVSLLWPSAEHAHRGMYFMDAAMILTFVTLGKFLEAQAKGRAAEAIHSLMDLAPRQAVVLHDGQPIPVPVDQIKVNDILVVRPGERVPLDAKIRSGFGGLDESWLTGESLPVEKSPGDEIFAGTLNTTGAITARVLRLRPETRLAQVAALVRKAQESKAPVQRLADAVVSWFVPAVLVLAVVTFGVWWALGDVAQAVRSAVAVLVVACPCALGLATPTAVLVASGRAARMGILIKDAAALELAGRLTHVLLDKTGTVTEGRPQVTMVLPTAGHDASEVLSAAANAEATSEHPLSRCIAHRARREKIEVQAAESMEVIAGQGIVAMSQGRTVLVGNERLLTARGVSLEGVSTHLASLREDGETPLLVAVNNEAIGTISVADVAAPHSAAAIAELQSLGLHVELLSGDHAETVRAVAQRVGLTNFTAGVLPEEKQQVIEQRRGPSQTVAMVGDGINDAAAMAAADVGIALATGADLAMEAADVVLTGHDLRGVVRTVKLSRATLRTIKQNLIWAFAYNLMLLPLAAGALTPLLGAHGRLPPAAAAAAMAASSVSVVANSLLLAWRKVE